MQAYWNSLFLFICDGKLKNTECLTKNSVLFSFVHHVSDVSFFFNLLKSLCYQCRSETFRSPMHQVGQTRNSRSPLWIPHGTRRKRRLWWRGAKRLVSRCTSAKFGLSGQLPTGSDRYGVTVSRNEAIIAPIPNPPHTSLGQWGCYWFDRYQLRFHDDIGYPL